MQKSFLKNKKILVVSPHPDDEAICAGGLIILAKKQQSKVFVLFGAIGNSRQFLTKSTNSNVRMKELKNAAKFGNYKYEIIFEGDEFMRLDSVAQKSLIEKIEDATEKFKPNIVVVPSRDSFDQDHRALSSACLTALRPLPPELRHQPEIILEAEEPYNWPNETVFAPNFFLDINTVFAEKIALLNKHATQVRKDPFPRSEDNLRRLAGFRGCEIGVTYAEGYKLLRGKFL